MSDGNDSARLRTAEAQRFYELPMWKLEPDLAQAIRDLLVKDRHATIEECARVAEKGWENGPTRGHDPQPYGTARRDAARAVRALLRSETPPSQDLGPPSASASTGASGAGSAGGVDGPATAMTGRGASAEGASVSPSPSHTCQVPPEDEAFAAEAQAVNWMTSKRAAQIAKAAARDVVAEAPPDAEEIAELVAEGRRLRAKVEEDLRSMKRTPEQSITSRGHGFFFERILIVVDLHERALMHCREQVRHTSPTAVGDRDVKPENVP